MRVIAKCCRILIITLLISVIIITGSCAQWAQLPGMWTNCPRTALLSTPLLGNIIKLVVSLKHWSSCHTSLIRPRSDFYWQMEIDGVACAEWRTFQPVYNLLKEWIFVTISFIQNLTVTRMCGHICKSTTLIGSILLSYWYLTGYWLVITAMSTTLWLAA